MAGQHEFARRQRVLAEFGDFVLDHDDLDEILNEACRLIAQTLDCDLAKVIEIERDSDQGLVRAGVGWHDGIVGQERISLTERSSEAFAVENTEPVITNDIAREDRFSFPAFLHDHGVVALVNVPIFLPGRTPYGVLQVDAREPREFDQEDIEFLKTYAMVLGPVVDRLQLAKEREAAHAQRAADLAAMEHLQRVSTLLVGERDPQDLYEHIVETASLLMGSDAASLQVLDPERRQLKLVAWRGVHPDSARIWTWVRADTGSSCGRALELGHRIVVPDIDRFEGDAEDMDAYRRSNILSVQSTPLKAFSGQVVGMMSTHWRQRREPSPDDYRYFDVLARLAADLIERVHAAERLRDSEERLRQFGEASQDVLWIRDAQTLQWQYLTPAFETIYGLGRDEALSGDNFRNWLDLIVPEDRDEARRATERVHEGEHVTFDYRIRRPKDGAVRWLRNTDFPIMDAEGRVRLIGGVGHDMTELREIQDQQQVLVGELQHRTRNLMGVVRSMADKTARSSTDLPEFRGRFRDQLDALARVQGLLSRLNEHDRVSFDVLIDAEIAALDGTADRVRVAGPKGVRLRSSTVQTLAMAIHELATNAVKYGALGQPAGKLTISWSLEPDGPGDRPWLHIDWRESGVSMPPEGAKPQGSGQGRELIERALPYQLKAKTSFELLSDGAHCTISIPVSQSATTQEAADD